LEPYAWQKTAKAPKPKYRLRGKGKNTFGMARVVVALAESRQINGKMRSR
jgi:hypothetical protein